MNNFISKSKLLATTAICAISVCANTVKAEEISISDILNNSTTKSPNISWEKVTSAGTDTIQIGDEYYKYTWTNKDSTRGKYTKHQFFTLSGDVVGDFIETSGGAIWNDVTLSSITGDFIGNSATSTNYFADGGAIYNKSTIESITGDFIGNNATYTSSYAEGGAIFNNSGATISSITGNFIGNIATATKSKAYGGAIDNWGTIGNIAGDFTGNSAIGDSSAYGGAIYNHNNATISSISGDFIGNSATSPSSFANGGAIYNYNNATISSITGDFIGNSASCYGGAIYNDGTIETIEGNFESNNVNSTNSYAIGGAIWNNGTISSITGDFIGNSVTGTVSVYGGAIYNDGTITSITGDFVGNSVTSINHSYAQGGAIFNDDGTISSIIGDFTDNSVTSTDGKAQGGAIYSGAIYDEYESTISSIVGDFKGNSATGNSSAQGGAIYNEDVISSITGIFTGNSVTSTNAYAQGGAIYNDGTISSINGDFIGNSAESASANNFGADGGAIYNNIGATISSITGDFKGNSATATKDNKADGGAIWNGRSTIESITGDFIGNSAESANNYGADGGAIYNISGTILSIIGNFESNSATATKSYARGGAIYSGAIYDEYESTISSIVGDFTGNNANSTSSYAYGGAIYNGSVGTISSITGDFEGNSATSTKSYARGGAIYNEGTISSITGDFEGNSATSTNYFAYGGAIYNSGTINFVADASDSEDSLQDDVLFQDNYTQSRSGDKKYEAIYNSGTINFESRNLGTFTFYDSIYNSRTINLVSDNAVVNNNIAKFNMYNNIDSLGTFNIKNPYTFNMINQEANIIQQYYFNIEAASTLNLDVILSTGISDRFSIDGVITGAEKFTLSQINLVDEMSEDVEYEKIAYSNQTLTKESKHELSTSENVYSVINDGKNLRIEKTDGIGGFAAFLANENNLGEERDYRFTKDEEMRHALIFGKDKTGYVQDKEAKLTILGNNKTLSGDGEILSAMNLKSGQTAEISNLTIKGFETGLINKGAMTLNNVNLKDNKVGLQNSGNVSLQGENTISGSDYAMYFEAGKSYEYPLYGANMDIDLIRSAAGQEISYAEYMKNMSEELSTATGQKLEFTNGAEYWDLTFELMKQQGAELPWNNELEFFQTEVGLPITEAQYNEALEAMKQYGKAHPAAGCVAYRSLNYGVSPLKFTQLFYSEDATEQEALIEELVAEMVANLPEDKRENITDDEIAGAKQELRDIIAFSKYEMAEIENMYAQVGAPSSYEYVAPAYKESTFDFAEGAILNLNSKVSGEVEYGLTLAGSDDAIINLNSEIEKADLLLDGPTLKLSDESTNLASVNSFEVKNGTLDMQNDVVRTLVASNFKVSGALKLFVDADLANKTMDTLGEVEVAQGGSISVDGIKIISDSAETETSVEFAEETYKDKVSTTVDNVLSTDYEYAVEYDETTGEFKFVRGNKIAPEEVAPNQAPVLSTTTTVATVETVVTQIFDRDVTISTDINYGADTTDYMETSDGVNIHNSKSVWVKTFGSDDDVKVENFSNTIDAEAYGVVGGIDSKVFTYDNGVKAAYGIYGAYVGGKQKYNDSKITQDSGYLGVSAAFRKSNLFSNFTLNGGYITSEANTEWGKDKFDTKVVSVANKTGIDIKTHNNWKITPALYVAYTGMDTEDYTNKAGVKMENEFSNVITIAPEIKASNRIGKDLDGYAKVSYKHYIYDTDVKADDVLLEEMSAKPYVEYGFGVEKNWADKSGYAEITRRSGGRTGWNVNLGLNFDF